MTFQCLKYQMNVIQLKMHGPVVPCNILLGTKKITEVVDDTYNQSQYGLQSENSGIHIILQHEYLDALNEAKDIVTKQLKKKYFVCF